MTYKSIIQGVKIFIVFYPLSVNAAVLFTEDFSDNIAGWILGNEWQIGWSMSIAGQSANPDSATDHTATTETGVAGVVIGGNASRSVHLEDFQAGKQLYRSFIEVMVVYI